MIKKIIIILCILCILGISGCSNRNSVDVTYSDSEDFIDFDHWLMDEVGVAATPCHIIIKGNKITNLTNYTVSYSELCEMKNVDILDIDISDKEINGYKLKDYDLIIIKKEDCPACEFQDENYATEILNKYKNKHILIYYIKTADESCLNGCD